MNIYGYIYISIYAHVEGRKALLGRKALRRPRSFSHLIFRNVFFKHKRWRWRSNMIITSRGGVECTKQEQFQTVPPSNPTNITTGALFITRGPSNGGSMLYYRERGMSLLQIRCIFFQSGYGLCQEIWHIKNKNKIKNVKVFQKKCTICTGI